jgi:hypothetical protein
MARPRDAWRAPRRRTDGLLVLYQHDVIRDDGRLGGFAASFSWICSKPKPICSEFSASPVPIAPLRVAFLSPESPFYLPALTKRQRVRILFAEPNELPLRVLRLLVNALACAGAEMANTRGKSLSRLPHQGCVRGADWTQTARRSLFKVNL